MNKLLCFTLLAYGSVATLQVSATPYADRNEITCNRPPAPTTKISAKLFFEHNSTDEDTGVHGAFDTSSFAELCVYNPKGKQILAVKPQGSLLKLTMGGIFFESREPPNEEVSIASLKADFPIGLYKIRGVSHDGVGLSGAATFTHIIPAPPVITFPDDEAVVDSDDLEIMWEPVTSALDGGPITITGYQVIVTKDVADDPHGFSRPTFDVHVPSTQTSIEVPSEFFEPESDYELEVLALEHSGNQTITATHFSVDE